MRLHSAWHDELPIRIYLAFAGRNATSDRVDPFADDGKVSIDYPVL